MQLLIKTPYNRCLAQFNLRTMELREYFYSIDLTEIDRYIQDKQEENINLEFKTVNHPNYNDKNREFDKINISTALSGFANSNGGIIIWGVKAKNNSANQDVAQEKKPIRELTKFLNLLNRLEGQAITPPITGILHEKIEISNDTGFIKTFIPQSENAPHMANLSGKHYYKRSGDSFYQCEHYDIVDMFSRKHKTQLKVNAKAISKSIRYVYFKPMYNRYQFMVSIVNEGKNIAKHPFLGLNLTNGIPNELGINSSGARGLKKVDGNLQFKYCYSGGTDIVIYPNTELAVDQFTIDILIDDGAVENDVNITYLIAAENMESTQGEILITRSELING